MNNVENFNPDFDINAKYEDMIERAKHNVDLYLETGKDCSNISLSYDIKNYLPLALEELQRLNNIIKNIEKNTTESKDWDCEVYKKHNCRYSLEDYSKDSCIFCGEPDERK